MSKRIVARAILILFILGLLSLFLISAAESVGWWQVIRIFVLTGIGVFLLLWAIENVC